MLKRVFVAPDQERVRLRITTRQAVQATLGGAFALGRGQLLSDQRWYWAVVGATWSVGGLALTHC